MWGVWVLWVCFNASGRLASALGSSATCGTIWSLRGKIAGVEVSSGGDQAIIFINFKVLCPTPSPKIVSLPTKTTLAVMTSIFFYSSPCHSALIPTLFLIFQPFLFSTYLAITPTGTSYLVLSFSSTFLAITRHLLITVWHSGKGSNIPSILVTPKCRRQACN